MLMRLGLSATTALSCAKYLDFEGGLDISDRVASIPKSGNADILLDVI